MPDTRYTKSQRRLIYLADVSNLQRRKPTVRRRTSCDVARSQKRTKVWRCPLGLPVPLPNLQQISNPWSRFTFRKTELRSNFLASTVRSVAAGESRTQTTRTLDVTSPPDIRYPVTTRYERCRSWLRQCATRRDVLNSILSKVLGNFQMTYSLCLHSVSLWSTQPQTAMSTKEFPWG
jgi:hypothetical protein